MKTTKHKNLVMNQKTILLLSIAIIINHASLLGNNDSLLIDTSIDEKPVEVAMNLEIDGAVKLYSALKEDIYEETEKMFSTKNEKFLKWILNADKNFYIGIGDKAELITLNNYKRLAKKYFSATPELVKRIGKRGFRYKNLPSMILYFNKMTANEGGLTKADILAFTN